MTGLGLSAERLWNIGPEDILVVDEDLNVIEGNGKATREINMHMEMYRNDNKMVFIGLNTYRFSHYSPSY